MIFRSADRAGGDVERREALLAAAEGAFGHGPDHIEENSVTVGGVVFDFDPMPDPTVPPFVLRPACDRCGCDDVNQFPLEEWDVKGVRVRAQALLTCRLCRFSLLATRDAPPIDLTLPPFADGETGE
jgi:hypothetical protein